MIKLIVINNTLKYDFFKRSIPFLSSELFCSVIIIISKYTQLDHPFHYITECPLARISDTLSTIKKKKIVGKKLTTYCKDNDG